MLSDYLRSQAAWRRRQKKEYPNDKRNDKSADAIEALAEYVDTLDPDAKVLERLRPHQSDSETLGGDRTWRSVARYGYNTIIIADHHAAFVDELAVLCELDAYEKAVAGGGEDAGGTLADFEVEAAVDSVNLPRRYFEIRLDASEDELKAAVERYRAPPEEGAEPPSDSYLPAPEDLAPDAPVPDTPEAPPPADPPAKE